MKKVLIWTIVLLTLLSSVYASLETELIAYYQSDDSTTMPDYEGNYDGTKNGDPTHSTTVKIINGSWAYDGTGDWWNTGSITELTNTRSFTTSLWVRPTTLTGINYGAWYGVYSDANNRVFIGTGAVGGACGGIDDVCVVFCNSGCQTANAADNDIAINTWYHVVLRYDGNGATDADKIKVYVNNVSKSLTFSGSPATTFGGGTQYLIGDPAGNEGYAYLDEVGLWNRSLSVSEITELYNDGAGLNRADFTGGGDDPSVTISEDLGSDLNIGFLDYSVYIN